MITLIEAINARRSVRQYKEQVLSKEAADILLKRIDEINKESGLHIQLIQNEPKAFNGPMAYGKFRGVSSYFVMAGKKSDDLDEKIGYYGEQLVLLSQQLGLNTCWAGLSYQKVADTYTLNDGEKIACYISLGYGLNQGSEHKRKSIEELCKFSPSLPDWFLKGVEAARMAPTAVNQQKFSFELVGENKVKANKGFSVIGYTRMDLGIAKLHFEIGAGTSHFEWAE